jgi:hypothetical protein
MRTVRLAVLVLICSLAARGSLPLLGDHLEALLTHSHSHSHQDQLPAQDSDLPAPFEEALAEGPLSDFAGEALSFLTPRCDAGPPLRCALRDHGNPRFSSSGELLDALHRLRI